MASVTLDHIRAGADPTFPTGRLEGLDDALLLFAGGFRGRNDGIHVADAGLTATCVDVRPDGLFEMSAVYPEGWAFVESDAFLFAAAAITADLSYDVVVVDSPTGLFDRCAELVDTWARLARRLIVLGSGETTSVTAPPGWRIVEVTRRSGFRGGVYWTVLEAVSL